MGALKKFEAVWRSIWNPGQEVPKPPQPTDVIGCCARCDKGVTRIDAVYNNLRHLLHAKCRVAQFNDKAMRCKLQLAWQTIARPVDQVLGTSIRPTLELLLDDSLNFGEARDLLDLLVTEVREAQTNDISRRRALNALRDAKALLA
jgi:hypothetical protein